MGVVYTDFSAAALARIQATSTARGASTSLNRRWLPIDARATMQSCAQAAAGAYGDGRRDRWARSPREGSAPGTEGVRGRCALTLPGHFVIQIVWPSAQRFSGAYPDPAWACPKT